MSTRSRRRKAEPAPRPWQPLGRAYKVPPGPERLVTIRAEAEARGADPDHAVRMALEPSEMYQNDRYTVIVERAEEGWVNRLSIRRNDRAAEPFPWRHLQRIKTELAGPDSEALELFPAESRLMDTANQRWLWCFPPGYTIPIGFNAPRNVASAEEAAAVGAVQAEEDR